MAVAKSKVGRFGLFLANPMVAKIDKVEEHGDPACSYKGIISKTFFSFITNYRSLFFTS